ncbi:ABC transporter ATP-binding protein [Enhydrobacter sp.]|uniref:ABC transporter ATP-binding protein n=1 Tax=Enhydrobacter sp. TaxID=1894999 RepID=UPI00260BE7E6|nr:ABC transporter ATP-binding protein [Enhydrobacter sp.]WIM10417.1 MAG: putative nucleoside ABC transporter, ATP-binding component [Enhydrobacter sp.]
MTRAPSPTAPPAIEFLAIDKSFGSVQAVRGVSLRLEAGTITGIIGENGAGKSTLMNILFGLHQANAGEIRIDGVPVRLESPHDAIAHGIGMVHQHFMLIESFTVLENLVLGAERGFVLRGGLAWTRAEVEQLTREYGLSVDPDARVADLSVGEQQRVEILKVLLRGARILILDEPSAVLTPQETDRLFVVLKALRQRGVTVLLITHKLREVMAVTDRVVVMRQGEVVAERPTAGTDPQELAELMVGRKVRLQIEKAPAHPGPVMLHADGLRLIDRYGRPLLDDVDLDLRAGEIVAIAGVSGNGQAELLQVLAGIRAPTAGSLAICGRRFDARHPGDPADRRAIGLAHVPEDRLRQGLVAPFPAAESSILGYQDEPRFSPRCLLDRPAIGAYCRDLMERFDVRPRLPGLRSSQLSGGNQQKLVLAREMAHEPEVLLVGQPTRGVDIGAIEFIHRELVKARDRGCAVLVVSTELDEVLTLADRVLVMFAGRIVGEVEPEGADERRLGLMMAGSVA